MAEVVAPEPPVGKSPGSDGSAARPAAKGPAAEMSPTPGPPFSTEAAPAAAGPAESPPAAPDVWSRTHPKYRIRAVGLLLVNLLLFCGLCIFTHWLHFDRLFEFSWSSYTAPLKFWGEQTQNLNDFVLYPVSVEQNPMHGVVLGLLVASIVAVPISVAILYRFPYALPFIAAVLIFAHMPWMALTLIGSCILCAVRPFRLTFRFGAALVGLLPVILYLYLATRPTPSQVGTYASPDQKLLLAAPWILAVIAATVMLAAILAISRMVNYRPTAVAPVMAVMFATPAILFGAYVGVDEVSYRVLEAEYGPRAPRWGQDVTDEVLGRIRTRLEESARQEFVDIIAGRPESLAALRRQMTRWLLRDLLSDRRTTYQKCKEFIADYPESRYVPCVLYLQGWALDLRLGPPRLLSSSGSVERELYSDFPHVQSEDTWLALLTGYPDSPLAIAARLRLAQLDLRRGAVDEAQRLLTELRAHRVAHAATQGTTQPTRRLWLRGEPPESGLAFEPEPFRREAQRLADLIRANRDDPKYGSRPLQELACLDPQRPGYRTQLLALAERYPGARLYDNLMVLWVESLQDREERAAQLEACIRDFANEDAVGEAMFYLAEIEVQSRGEDQEQRRQAGIARLSEIVTRFGQTYWAQEAAKRLRILSPPAESTAARVPP